MPVKRKNKTKPRAKPKKTVWEIDDIVVKSKEELWFAYWLEECKDNDIVKDWQYEAPTFPLSNDLVYMGAKIDQSKSITPDYTIEWNTDYLDKVYYNCSSPNNTKSKDKPLFIVYNTDCNSNISHIDVKPANERRNSSSVSFPYKRSWLINSKGIWIQKVKPLGTKNLQKGDIGALFQSSFTPTKITLSGDLVCKKGVRAGLPYSWVKWDIKPFGTWFKTL